MKYVVVHGSGRAVDITDINTEINFTDNDGNLVRLERCNFSANGGIGIQDDLGAALAFSDDTVRFSQRVTSIRHEVVNW